ncbi:GPP34 family phosphoprotein [Cryobacterium sp. M23]|uniref:GPP34 family phosphoprotein n=1 Tax=Cryobacterium sp. M23 TaxID=2048292 RepID=UPI000CE47A51|nr:GPP34 family phosphoprotein [Cryobacterium sp. M23]
MTDATTSVPSIAEDIQLMLQQRPGQLEPDQIMPGAGALIELALEGRILTDPKDGFLTEPADNARLVVVDDSPTGSAMLDALAVVSARRRPPFTYKVLQPVTVAVVPHLYVALVERGVVRETGGYPTGRDRLEIADESVFLERKSVLARARTLPATVSDPRIGRSSTCCVTTARTVERRVCCRSSPGTGTRQRRGTSSRRYFAASAICPHRNECVTVRLSTGEDEHDRYRNDDPHVFVTRDAGVPECG